MLPGQGELCLGSSCGDLSLWGAGLPVSHLPCEVGTQSPFHFIDYKN